MTTVESLCTVWGFKFTIELVVKIITTSLCGNPVMVHKLCMLPPCCFLSESRLNLNINKAFHHYLRQNTNILINLSKLKFGYLSLQDSFEVQHQTGLDVLGFFNFHLVICPEFQLVLLQTSISLNRKYFFSFNVAVYADTKIVPLLWTPSPLDEMVEKFNTLKHSLEYQVW